MSQVVPPLGGVRGDSLAEITPGTALAPVQEPAARRVRERCAGATCCVIVNAGAHEQDVAAIKSRIERQQIIEAAQKQSGHDYKHE